MGVCVCVSLPSTWEKRVTPDRCLFYAATKPTTSSAKPDFTHAGGHSMSLGLCPTKLPVAWEERTEHPFVPARQPPVVPRLEKDRPPVVSRLL